MSASGAVWGPVSEVLEADVRSWVRQHGIVIWLDLDGHYSAFVDRLTEARAAGRLPYEVRGFRGSYLSLMLALEGVAAGADKVPLLVHLPGLNEDRVRLTPMLETYEAGTRYRKALDTLVGEAAAGRARPDEIDAFRAQPGSTLELADTWLAERIAQVEGGLPSHLRGMAAPALLDNLLSHGPLASSMSRPDTARAMWDRLETLTGVPQAWRAAALPTTSAAAEDVAFAVAGWALAVEYADDVGRAPVSPLLTDVKGLPRPVLDACRDLAAHLRDRHPAFYRRTADETEVLIAEELAVAEATDLGKVDTFRFEEERVLQAALTALERGEWDTAARWSQARVDGPPEKGSFWLRQEPSRRSAWLLVGDAACLGQAIARAGDGLHVKDGVDEALVAYAERGAAVDQAHRHMEQRRVALLYPPLPQFETLRAQLDKMRAVWRQWADAWARDFNVLCRAHGFLPSPRRQQRAVFDDVVRPLTQQAGATAFFVVDALRFEMGEELHRLIGDTPATTVQLEPRLAELPTVTAVGMNVLAPIAPTGRLRAEPAPGGTGLLGFSTGEFRVFDAETRKRAMHDRVGGSACPWLSLEEVVNRDSASLRRAVAQARLIVVHSQEIDNAGEKGIGAAVFDVVMQKLRAAWRLLRDAGVRRFVFTSDHGFLLLDETSPAQTHGRRIDPKRRHVFSRVPADHPGEVRVSLADLGYEGAEAQLMFPETTAVFDTGRRSLSFAHGGNSLQERVIPVLTVVHRAAAGGSSLRYAIAAEVGEPVAGMQCVYIEVAARVQGALDFGSQRDIELALRVPDADDVQVELCQVRGKARIVGGALQTAIGERVEVFFRLTGVSTMRVQVEVHHPGGSADVEPCRPEARFDVGVGRGTIADQVPTKRPTGWLEQLPEGGVRDVFAHLDAHGTITETEAADLLGGPRGVRRFTLHFESYAQKAPFSVRIDVVAGVKRFVSEGRAG